MVARGAMGGETDTAEATSPRDGYDPIVVHLEASVEPEDVDDNPGCGLAGGTSATADADGTPVPTGRERRRHLLISKGTLGGVLWIPPHARGSLSSSANPRASAFEFWPAACGVARIMERCPY